ncbi:MAG: hypothetical protein M3480_01775, partial [Verrucomicrobiota bacterium]|nr:hypothetical protein [Verrucomicrobiota bacterium]
CGQGSVLLVDRRTGRYWPALPDDEKTKTLIAEILETLGAISTMTSDSLLPWRIAGAFARHPRLALRLAARAIALAGSGGLPLPVVTSLLRGRAHTLNIGTHNFMDASRVANAPNDPVTQARLEACVFKGAVKNRANGEWEAVPMCAMNESRWSELYAERLEDPALAMHSFG